MTGRVYEWKVTNATTTRVAFDDKTLDAQKSVTVHRLTDDILSGWSQGQLLISPDPSKDIAGLLSIVGINPCQLPLPVRVVGEATHPVGNSLVDAPPINVAAATRVQFLSADRRRRMFRVRNTGTQPLWLGGNSVTETNGFIQVLPNEIYTESDVPTAAWFAYVAANLSNNGGTFMVQQVFAGTV